MKNIKIKHSLLALLIGSIAFFSCNDDSGFLDDNLTLTGRHFPVIASFYLENSTYPVGTDAQAITVYWSEGTIKELQLFATVGSQTETLISTTSYSANFIDSVRADVTVIPYTVPNVASGITIDLRVSIINENGLSKDADDSFTVE
jgi:hypothetical protein